MKYRVGYARATMIPYLFIAYPLAGILIGWWLDSKLKTSPWLLLVFLMAGMYAAFREMLQIAKQAEKEYEREDKEDKEKKNRNG